MKQDHRVRLTRLLLRDAFLSLLLEKPVTKITVKELCEKAAVNRATFYAHYHDIYALYEEIEHELAQTIMQSLNTTEPGQSFSAFSIDICKLMVENKQSCQAIFGEYGDPAFPQRIVETLRKNSLELWQKDHPDLSLVELNRFYTFIANGCLAVVRSWVHGGMDETPEEIAHFIEKITDISLSSL